MKKTVQIVTIPLGGKGVYKADDLIKKPAFKKAGVVKRYRIAIHNFNGGIWQSQQLLVLNDDEIIKDDYFYHGVCNKVFKATSEDVARIKLLKHSHPELVHAWITIKPNHYARKVIASYPQIEGTLPISKETVQAWIDAGTPLEATLKEALRGSMCLDPQGNLLLEFAQPFKSTMPIYTVPSIPTDEEIERKAHNNYTYGYLMPIGSHDRSRYEEKKESYTSGYKQALKDLGHADN
jgi:hypothetical protein